MRTSSALTLGNAAKATGKTKSTILRAIQKSKISAAKDADGQWRIEPAELFRHFKPVARGTGANATNGTLRNPPKNPLATPLTDELGRQLERLEAERERERGEHQEAIAREREIANDLRRRLDQEGEERRRTQQQLTALLTDQRQRGEAHERREQELETMRAELDALKRRRWWRPWGR